VARQTGSQSINGRVLLIELPTNSVFMRLRSRVHCGLGTAAAGALSLLLLLLLVLKLKLVLAPVSEQLA